MERDPTFSSASEVIERGSLSRGVPPATSTSPASEMGWADASSLLDAASKDLQEGELIHGDNFNLFAAMSALEIMDPKMDPGVICRYSSVDAAIENGAAPVPFSDDKTNDMRHTIDLMDHLLACEVTWHKGHSLAQTVFSCIYLLKPERTLSHMLLHSYCTVVRATCSALLSVVADTRTNEEEDFFTITYDLPLRMDGDEHCLSILSILEETISQQLHACSGLSNENVVTEAVEPLQNNTCVEKGYYESLLCRLRFRKNLFHVLSCLRLRQEKDLNVARKHIASCISELECILKSSEFLESSARIILGDKTESSTTASGCKPLGFDATLNCRLTAPAPPRSFVIFSWKEAIEYFRKLLHDLDVLCSCSMPMRLEDAFRFIIRFQKLRPDLISRAHMQLLLIQDGKLWGQDSMFSIISKASLLAGSRQTQELQKVEFVIQLEQLVINLLRILCTNAAWQRRKLGKLVQDWRVTYLQIQLAFNEKFYKAPILLRNEHANACECLLIWVDEQTYWIASRFIFLGFDLELYSPFEYCMVYWYLYVVLLKLAEIIHQKILMSIDSGKQKIKKKRSSSKDVLMDSKISPTEFFLQCHICLAEGLFMMLAALRNKGGLFGSRNVFNTEQETFFQHFYLLQRARLPENTTYHSYKESTSHVRFSTILSHNRFEDAKRIAVELKSLFADDPERLAELRQLEQVAKWNHIALKVISRVQTLDLPLKISFEFTHHPYYAVVVVKRS